MTDMIFKNLLDFPDDWPVEKLSRHILKDMEMWNILIDNLAQYLKDDENIVQLSLSINQVLSVVNGGASDSDLKLTLNDFYLKYSLPLYEEFASFFKRGEGGIGHHKGLSLFLRVIASENIIALENNSDFIYYSLALFCKINGNSNSVVSNGVVESIREKINLLNNSFKSSKDEMSNIRSELEKIKKESESTVNEVSEKYRSDVLAIKKTFENEIQLRSAVAYWDEKKSKHQEFSKYLLRKMSWIIPAGVCITAFLIFKLFGFASAETEGTNFLDKNFKYVVSLLLITLVVWAIRLAVKIWLSNVHLANDADERVVLVKTYLALQKDNVMPDDGDRRVVINSLFRQATDGVVKDDGIPNPILEQLTRNR